MVINNHHRLALLAPFFAAVSVFANQSIYVDSALSSGWENWSWGTDINFAATDSVAFGSSSLSATSSAYAALSLYDETAFGNAYAGIKFDLAIADPSQIQFTMESTSEGISSPWFALSAIPGAGNATATKFATLLLDFNSLPPNGSPLAKAAWNRISFQALGNGATYHLDNIELVSEIVVTPLFLGAEPLANNVIAVTTQGAVDLTKLIVKLNNSPLVISNTTTYIPPDTPSKSITYLNLKKTLAPGNLTISAGNTTFSHVLPAVQYGAITGSNTKAINPLIYGVNWPTNADYVKTLGVTVSRWGGNSVTAYNPFGGFTNAGNDWYFENRANEDADAWLGWVKGAGSKTMLTLPALDWVSKDSTSYSYPKSDFPDQKSFDPYNGQAGNGVLPNGSYVTPTPDQNKVYTPWNTSLAIKWLSGLVNKPDIIAIDNEIEIAHSTHQDMHPAPMSYDEELARVVTFATAAKTALPNVKVAAPSTCSWWFYWTSAVGYTDNAAHYNIDFLPWFLDQMKIKSAAANKRLLDYLDIHYYFQPDTSANNAAAKALRLRMTRSLWDPSYVDESWVGTSPQNHQPNPTAVWLIPRMKQLIAQYYPGTLLSISEWSSTNDADITGGLVTVDALGLFGVYGVDAATYWLYPDEKGPVGLAYWLFRGSGTYFGDLTVQVNLANQSADTLGVYAGKSSTTGKVSLVIVNKDIKNQAFDMSNVPHGTYFMRHFGGASGTAKWQTKIIITTVQYIVVPSYAAVFLQQQ